MNPAEIAETLTPQEVTALASFEPGIWDAVSVFERYVPLVGRGLLNLGDRCKFTWTEAGRNVLYAIQHPEEDWFWCEACKAWLNEDNTIHEEGAHQ